MKIPTGRAPAPRDVIVTRVVRLDVDGNPMLPEDDFAWFEVRDEAGNLLISVRTFRDAVEWIENHNYRLVAVHPTRRP